MFVRIDGCKLLGMKGMKDLASLATPAIPVLFGRHRLRSTLRTYVGLTQSKQPPPTQLVRPLLCALCHMCRTLYVARVEDVESNTCLHSSSSTVELVVSCLDLSACRSFVPFIPDRLHPAILTNMMIHR